MTALAIDWPTAREVLLSGGTYPAWLFQQCIESMRHHAWLGNAEAKRMTREWDEHTSDRTKAMLLGAEPPLIIDGGIADAEYWQNPAGYIRDII